MLDYENKEQVLKFGDLVRYKMKIKCEPRFIYSIFCKEEEDSYFVRDGKGDFRYISKDKKLERIGSIIDKNILDLIPKGESL